MGITKKIIFTGLILVLLASCSVIPLFAKEEKDYINQAIKYLDENKYTEAVGELEEALILVKSKASLEFANVLFSKEEGFGYGLYNARENAVFAQGETFFIYGEPKNYHIKENEKNLYEIYLKEDIYILDMNNNVLFGQVDFGELHITSHRKNSEVMLTSTIEQIEPFPVGNYKFRLVLKDVFSQKTTETIIEFSVVE